MDLWEAVRDVYDNQNNYARIFQIRQDIANLRQDGQPFVNLLSKMKSLWNKLEVYRPHSIDPVILRKRTEEDQVFQLLASLKPDFEDLRCHILMNAELPSLKNVCETIQREEIRRKVMTRDSTASAQDVRAYLAHQSSEKKPFTGKHPDLKCKYCNSIGHSVDHCWSLHPKLKPKFTKDKKEGDKKRVTNRKAHLATHTIESFSSSPVTLLNDFASFLQEKHGLGTVQEGAGHEEPIALLSKFARF